MKCALYAMLLSFAACGPECPSQAGSPEVAVCEKACREFMHPLAYAEQGGTCHCNAREIVIPPEQARELYVIEAAP